VGIGKGEGDEGFHDPNYLGTGHKYKREQNQASTKSFLSALKSGEKKKRGTGKSCKAGPSKGDLGLQGGGGDRARKRDAKDKRGGATVLILPKTP